MTPLKNACLAKCRSPLGFLLGSWRDGSAGAVEMGSKHAAWCVGCCWALMAALCALAVMSLVWMAVVAALIAAEKTIPWRRSIVWITTAMLLALGEGGGSPTGGSRPCRARKRKLEQHGDGAVTVP